MKFLLSICLLTWLTFSSSAKDGYELWLDYSPVENAQIKSQIDPLSSGVFFFGDSPTYELIRKEFEIASQKMLGKSPVYTPRSIEFCGTLVGNARASFAGPLPDQQVKIKDLGED